jgi:hypothetical protein
MFIDLQLDAIFSTVQQLQLDSNGKQILVIHCLRVRSLSLAFVCISCSTAYANLFTRNPITRRC